MSVLNFPRIYLNGHMFWNPPTANNNDVLPLYDAVKMDINWPFTLYFDITQANAPTTLMPWMIKPVQEKDLPPYVTQVPGNDNPGTFPFIPAEWDLFGDNACGTVSYQSTRSTIIGGELQANTYISQDALVGRDYQLLGNPFGSQTPTAARFVDISPWQNTFTALYFDKLQLGDATCGLTLNRQYRMLDRFLSFKWAALFHGLAYVTTTWQTCFSRDNLEWVVGESALLKNLKEQMELQGAQGLMFRFSNYLTCYDRNGVFNDFPYVNSHSSDKSAMDRLTAMYQKGLDNVSDIFFNPAYNRTAATLGLWFADEYPTAPAGRRLIAAEEISVTSPAMPEPKKTTLGIISAQITDNTLSLDLANTFPFYPLDKTADILTAERFQAGDYKLGVSNNGSFTPVVDIGFDQYQQSAFNLRSGLLDFPLSAAQAATLQSGPLALQLQAPQPSDRVIAAAQQVWTAEVVESGTFVDVNDHKTLNIMVQKNGQPAANTTLFVAEYGNPYNVTTSDYYLTFSNDADFTLFYDNAPDRSQNSANLPQFQGTPPISNYVTTGSGRRLVNLETRDKPVGDPVSYQAFMNGSSKPITVPLKPCLQFDAGVYVTGTLEDNQAQVNYSYVSTTTNDKGIAQVSFRALAAGFPTLRFIVKDGVSDPAIPFSFALNQAQIDFLAPLRVLPLDMQLQQDFVNHWNDIYRNKNAPTAIWEEFIYPRVLKTFYYLYPIMNKFMPLNSQTRVEGAVDQLIRLISKEYQEESTLAMPITRDLSQSRRAVLELWAQKLVKRNFPPVKLNMSDYDDL